MRGGFSLGICALAALATAVALGSLRTDKGTPPLAQPTPWTVAPRAPVASDAGTAAFDRGPSRGSTRMPQAQAAVPHDPRDERLVRSAGLSPPGRSPAERLLASHSPEELALFSELERLTGPRDSRARELIARRRAGASAAELRDLATRLFAGDPLARAAALGWLRRAATPASHP